MKKKPNNIRTILFCFVALLLFYFLLEISLIGFFAITKIFFSLPEINLHDYSPQIFRQWDEEENIHPYLGYVTTPKSNGGGTVSEFGFIDSKLPIQIQSDDKIIIGIFGGSVAQYFSIHGTEALEKKLKKLSFFSNKKIIFLNFGMGGYKQPQQLMILNYILALGGHFDIVINLDGFNEIALPPAENIPDSVFPYFPRSWHRRIASEALDREEMAIIATIFSGEERRKKIRTLLLRKPWRYSITLNTMRKSLDLYLLKRTARERLKLLKYRGGKKYKYAVTGPPYHYKSEEEMYSDLANIWKNCSLQMHRLCKANDIQYFHFLQPNQYVPNSKLMTKKERKIALDKNHPYREPVIRGYPYLIESSRKLVDDSVNFYNLTMIFANNNELLYNDNVAHLNKKGNLILGTVIGKNMAEAFNNIH